MSAFAHFRNSRRLVEKVEVNFESHGARFLSDSLVDKLLIQNKGKLPWKAKDSLVLSMLESLLEDNPYIDNAEVFHFQQRYFRSKYSRKKKRQLSGYKSQSNIIWIN